MVLLEVLGIGLLSTTLMVVVAIVAGARIDRKLKGLILGGILLHILGAVLYRVVIGAAYGGGDYLLYLEKGHAYAERMHQFDFSMFTDPAEWWGGKWTGTQFVFYPVAIIDAVVGPSVMLQFIAFGMLSLLALLCFGLAFHRTHPEVPVSNYLRWVILFPSLWFWPSAPGKEAIIMFGAGLTVCGYCGHKGRINWSLLGLGLLLVFAIRPQVALVFFAALVLAPWLAVGQAWSVRRVAQGLVLGAFAVIGMTFATRSLGMSEAGAAEVAVYLEAHGKSHGTGGSDIQTASASWTGVPAALIAVWLRPFPWEARSLMAMLSVLEIGTLWCAILTFRRPVVRALKEWRHDRLLRLSVPFLLLYSTSAGMTMWNLGILARQRILLFPILFFLFEVVPRELRGRTRTLSGAGSPIDVIDVGATPAMPVA